MGLFDGFFKKIEGIKNDFADAKEQLKEEEKLKEKITEILQLWSELIDQDLTPHNKIENESLNELERLCNELSELEEICSKDAVTSIDKDIKSRTKGHVDGLFDLKFKAGEFIAHIRQKGKNN